ncbi:acyltransferase family protein [Solitalea koreensis]|uniref:Peptidoglycan/LPS O-acetylase OafA/YrhL, contains acyltransferase and SGNH-hydrolase domains n=1 Tax=Solitalea koreensis TaxID=543615 RepID=A0A521D806_9SPHI|nr:acyltransferase [Solitalea koreensis]SMO67828.1 Peptidoglycan/LPS O-acetylase OafA/YrhL, contains acyltransferase and SGNH-hydrolase domains [Solitalea koreensis]
MHKNIKYFPGLSALRFFAAFFVLMHHSETIRKKYGLFNLEAFSLFQNGSTAVSFFFVLSGFLISYLLLKEDRDRGGISVKAFYWRRVVRIWPLYFLLVAIGLYLVPFGLKLIHFNYPMPYIPNQVLPYFLLFMPFMVNILFGSSLLEPLWSIGVEEIFYLIWAPLMKFFHKHMLNLFVAIILIKTALMTLFFYFINVEPNSTWDIVKQVIDILKFEAMAIGGVGAYLVYYASKDKRHWKIFSPVFQVVCLILLFLRVALHHELIASETVFGDVYSVIFAKPVLSNLVLYVLFLWLIVNVSMNPKSFLKLEKKWLNSLGDVSYGIYMYQMLIIFAVVLVLKKHLMAMTPIPSTILFYFMIAGVTIGISYLSKYLFENQFLKLKGLVK